MVTTKTPPSRLDREVFLDASYAVALASEADENHDAALRLAGEIESAKVRMYTHRGVLLEIGNSLARRRTRGAGTRLLRAAETDKLVTIVPLTDDLYARGLVLYGSRPDKDWGMVDCVSFTVMTDRGLKSALTADEHFVQAGFRALLREPA